MVGRHAAADCWVCSDLIGQAVSVKEGLFEAVKLSDSKGKWTILLFFPMAFTYSSLYVPVLRELTRRVNSFVCPTELVAFASRQPDFESIGAQVFGVSTDSEYSLLAWTNTRRDEGGLGPDFKLRLVSDKNHRISRDYGVLLEDEGVALRGLFIIDPKGTLRQITINDLPVGRSVDEALRLVKALQFVRTSRYFLSILA